MRPSRTTGASRGGFTLIELLVVNLLLTLLVVLIAGAWRAFGPLCVEVIARGRIVNEANIAAQAIYQDTTAPANLALGNIEAFAMPSGDPALQFDYGDPGVRSPGPWKHVVRYVYTPTPDDPNSAGTLVRLVGDSQDHLAPSIAVARHVDSAVALALGAVGSAGKSQIQYTLSFAYRGSQSQYTFVIHN